MEYSIAAIPTVYSGIQFRSRLEAKWASMFTHCGFTWDYEPNDFNGYIPDFRIGHTYLEVKPARDYDEAAAYKAIKAISFGPDCAEVRALILLKDAPERSDLMPFGRHIGWFLDPENSSSDCADRAILLEAETWNGSGPEIRFYISRATECTSYRLDPLLPNTIFEGGRYIDENWALACNASQWKAPA